MFEYTGFAKQGTASVGVARQYSGTLGKVGNCQVTVICHYAERTLAWPVATRLYLPESWASAPERRQKAQVPETVQLQTKVAIALDLLDEAKAFGVKYACVVADADNGDTPAFLNGLEQRQARMVANVRADFTVATARQAAVPGQRADALLAAMPRWQWQTIRWREGSTGWLRAKFEAIRGWRLAPRKLRTPGLSVGGQAASRGPAGLTARRTCRENIYALPKKHPAFYRRQLTRNLGALIFELTLDLVEQLLAFGRARRPGRSTTRSG